VIILILSDVHANLPALEAVIAAAGSFDEVWNLGDTVGYGASPNECVELIRELPQQTSIAGNHDLAATGKMATTSFNPVAAAANHWTSSQLTAQNSQWLEGLNSLTSRGDMLLAHGSPRDPVSEYLTNADVVEQNFPYFSEPVCLVGHTHVGMMSGHADPIEPVRWFQQSGEATVKLPDGKWILNLGSVGQPRDGDSRAAFGVLNMDQNSLEFRRVRYDVERSQSMIIEAGLPPVLASRLPLGR
jgi:diadenosine tetraphosphatase ApaH/serine/threonine PP2A family protein phosphatase